MATRNKTKPAASPAASAPAPATSIASINAQTLRMINDATKSGGFLYAPDTVTAPMVAAGLVEINPDPTSRNAAGDAAVRTTASADAWLAANAPAVAAGWQSPAAPSDGSDAGESTEADEGDGSEEADENDGSEEGEQVEASADGSGEGDDYFPAAFNSSRKRQPSANSMRAKIVALGLKRSLHVPKSAERPNPFLSLSSTVSAVNAEYAIVAKDAAGNDIYETKLVNVTQKDANGDPLLDAQGNKVTKPVERQYAKVTGYTRKYGIVAVGKDDPKGEGVRIARLS